MPALALPCARRAVAATVILLAIAPPVAAGAAWCTDLLLGLDGRTDRVAGTQVAAAPERETR